MKRRIVCCIVLTLAVTLVPQGQAATQCVHFTNFCDSLQVQTASGTSGTVVYGGWDWLCTMTYTDAQIAGIARGGHAVLTSRPTSPYLSAYTFIFDFNLHTNLFDLYATDGNSRILLQTNQPWTANNGACRADDSGRGSKPRTTPTS